MPESTEDLLRKLLTKTAEHGTLLGGVKDDITEMKADLGKLDEKYVSKPEHKALDDRVVKVEGSHQWLTRMVIGAVVLAVVGLVLSQGGLP